jgi:lambda family phage minor tail protein L
MAVPVSELQKVNPSAIIELFVLELNVAQHGVSTVYRFHAGTNAIDNGDVYWDGNAYTPMPIEADGFEYTGSGQIPRPKIRISNLLGTITTLLQTLAYGLEGAKVTRIRTMARYLDDLNWGGGDYVDPGYVDADYVLSGTNPYGTPDPTAEFPREIYYVDQKTAENRDVIEYELAAAFDLQGTRVPKRQTIQNVCQWKYRSYNSTTSSFEYTQVDCPYTGGIYYKADDTVTTDPALDQCGKRLSSCQKRFGYVELTGDITNGSNLFNVDSGQADELARIDTSAGLLFKGVGIPDGTTITGKSATQLTLSANATASTTVNLTGTIVKSGLAIKMTSNPVTAGIVPGMLVTGIMVPSGTRVEKVSASLRIVYLTITDNLEVWSLVYPGAYVDSGYVESGYISDTDEGIYTESSRQLAASPTTSIGLKDRVIGDLLYADTRVKAKGSSYIRLNKAQAIADGETVSFGVYERATRSSATYTFEAPDTFVAQPQAGLPYGSFPGVGQYR